MTGGVLQVGTAALASSLGNNILANTVAVGTGGTLSIVNLAGGANPLLNAITNNTGGVGTVNVNSVNTVTLGGPLTNTAGTLALAQTNILGTTILTNAGNTYAGGTTVSAGVLQVGTAALASSLGSNVAGNTVSVGNGATLSIVNLIAGANPLLNNITNNLAGTGLVNVNSANANTLGGILSNGAGTLALMQSGLGTTTLTGANTYTGATTVALGTLQIGNGAIGSISTSTPVTVNGPGTLDINVIGAGGGIFANTVLNNGVVRGINAAATTQTYSGVISGAGSFSQISGTGIFTNVNTYAGGTTINGPTTTLQIGTGVSAAAAGSGNININGGSTLSLVNVSGNLLSNNMTNTAGGLAGTVAVNSALTTTISGSIKDGAGGPLQLNHNGTGTTILTNTGNTYTGLTTINAGLLQIGTIAQAGSIGGGTPIKIGAGATLSIVNLGNPGTLSNTVIQNSLGGIGTLNVNSFLNNTITSQLTDGGLGTLALTQTGTGTTFLTGAAANTYTGGTTITAGTLSVGNGGAVGLTPLGTGIVTNNAALTFNATNALLVIGNNIGGTGNLSQIGAGTTALTGANTYTGTTLISAGALQVGNGGAAGTLGVGAVTDNASLIFNRSDAFSVANAIGGTGNVTQQGTGVTTLTGASNYTGTTTVVFGNLRVNGSLGNTAVTVNSGATLSGFGSIAGSVNILGGGNLNPGTSPGTVTFGSLVLNPLSNSNFELGVPGVIGQAVLPGNDLVNVTGNLTIDGILNVTQLAGFGPGSYRLFNYGGVLTNNIIDSIVGAPVGSTIVTGVANQVNLLVLNAGAGISQFWDGAGLPNDALIAGGNGNWDNFNNNFTNAAGTVNSAWQNGTAVFGSAAGTVTLINPINAQGLAFTVSGYVINGLGGNTLNLVGPAPAPTITVGAGLSATINAQITGANGLTADGAGTLFLNNVGNSYTGGTTINGGTVSVSNDGSLGAAAGGLTLNNGILQATSTFSSARTIALTGPGTIDVTALNTFTETGIVSGGAGFALNKTGTGTLNLTNVANSYLGGTVIQGGILQVTSNANLGNVAGGVTFVNNATLQTLGAIASARAVTLNAGGGTIDTNGFNSTLSGVIGGAAGNNLTKIGAGTLIATGTSTYLGATNVNAGTLQVGDGVLLNSQIGNNTANVVVNNGAALAVNLANAGTFGNTVTVNAGGAVNAIGANAANTQTLSGVISGAGVFNQNSAGATVITGVNTYTGVTNVNTGTLQIGNGLTGNLNALSQVNVAGGATLAANLGNLQTLGNNIANAGTINSINGAAVTQTISGNITGVGTFNQTNAGTTFLTGASTYTGATNVGGNGTLRVNGSLGNTAVTVQSGATLGGVGNIAGSVTVLAGGNLAAGNSAGTITIGTLVLNAGSNSNFELATPGIIGAGVNDLVNVTGNLTIDGNLNLTAVAPPFGSGSYRLFNYGGVLTNNVFDAITGVPVGFTTAVVLAPGQVNLLVLGNGIGPVQTWDGPGPVNNGVANGGSGNWDNFQNNWTGVGGANPNAAWQNGTAVFGAPNGTVTITDTVNAQGLIFGTNGYVINGLGGNTLNLVGQNPAVASVPFISVTNAGDNATINAQITNTAILPVFSNGLSSTGAGRLVLTNVANNYTGGTNISGTGTVSISSDTNLGASGAGNGVTFGATGGVLQITSTFTLGAGLGRNILLTGNGAIDVTDSNTVTYGSATSVISGAGALSKTGTGTLNLVGVNTYSGGTSILGGVLQVANDNALGNVAGGLTFANNATLQTLAAIVSARVVTLNAGGGTVDTNGFNSTLSGVIGGVGSLTKAGAGTLLLTGVETYTGATNVNGGTLQVGNGVSGNLAAASVVNVNNVSTFGVNLANGGTLANTIITSLGAIVTGNNGAASTQTLSGVISGAGALNQNGAGTTILTAANTYTGTTTALQGTLQIGNGATGSISVSSAVSTLAGATLALNLANGGIFANDVANAGAVNGLVAGANVNTISGIISGVGVLNQNGTGTTILTGANSYSGATTVNFGTLQIGNGLIGSINPASPVTVAGGATLAVNLVTGGTLGNNIVDNGSVNAIQTGINNIIGVISGTGVFNQNGTGTTNVSGANTYLGLTTVNAGILEVRNNTALGTVAAGTVVINGASLRLATGITVGAEALTINGFGAAGTTGALTNVAGGTATYGGAITAATNSSISSNGGNLTLTGGIVKTNVALILNNAGGVINVNGVGITGDLVGFNDDLVANGGTTNLNVANNYVGPTWLINGATVNANVINALPNSNNVNLALRTTVEFENQSGATPGVMAAGTGGSILSLGAAQSAQWIDGSFGAVPASRINLNGNILTLGTTALPNGSVAPPLGGAPDFRGVIADGTGAAGSGGVTKDGLNTQILSGLNTYTGATRVTGGTLRAGSTQAFGVNSPVLVGAAGILDLAGNSNTIGSLSDIAGVGGIVQNTGGAATLTTGALGANTAYAGLIQGPTALVLVGGAQALSNNLSSYTNGTTVNGGTLNINASSLPAPGVGPVTGPIGTGLLTINGGGIGTTSAGLTDNDVANAVQINNGFNVTGNAVNVIGGPVVSNGVTFSGPVNLGTTPVINTTSGFLDLTGVVSGGGNGITFTGNTFTLIGRGGMGDAPNTFTGLTDVQGGLVLLGKGSAIAGADGVALAGNVKIDAGAVLQVNSNFLSGGGTANNQIARTASAIVNGILDIGGTNQTLNNLNGSGIVRLDDSAVNAAFAGAPGTRAGVLTVSSGFLTGSIVDGGLNGQLVKNTGGTLYLTGVNTYLGNTTINGGRLIVDGSIASRNTYVNAGGLLGGRGIIGGNVFNSGVVSPGSSVATLTIKGNYTQSSAGTLVIEVAGKSAGQHDLLAVGGTANLDGTVRILNTGAVKLKRGDKITFLTAGGGVNGTFANESNGFKTGNPLLEAHVIYGSNIVSLQLLQGSFAALNGIIGLTPNQIATARALDQIAGSPKLGKVLDHLDALPLNRIPQALDDIAPEEFASITSLGVSLANVQTANLQRRMSDIRSGGQQGFHSSVDVNGYPADGGGNYGPSGKGGKELVAPADRVGVFITGAGEFSNIAGTFNARGYDLTTGGFTLGVDYRLTDNLVVGLMTGYANTGIDLFRGGRISVDGGKVGIYATYFSGGFYVDTAVSGGYNTYETQRRGLLGTARGSTDGGEFNGLIATGYDVKRGGLTFGPVASFQYTYVGIGKFAENGSLTPLQIGGQHNESTRTALGVKASYDMQVGGVVVRPEVRAAWQHEFADVAYAVDSRFSTGGGGTFTVNGPELGRDSLLLGAGFAVLWNERTSTYVYYDGELGRTNYNSQNVSGGVRMSF